MYTQVQKSFFLRCRKDGKKKQAEFKERFVCAVYPYNSFFSKNDLMNLLKKFLHIISEEHMEIDIYNHGVEPCH